MPRKGAIMRVCKTKLEKLQTLSELIIRGFDGEGDGGDTGGSGGTGQGGGTDSGGTDTGGEGDDTGGGDDGGDDDGDDTDLPDDNAELKKALKAERTARRAAEKASKTAARDAKRLQKAQDDAKTAEEGETAAAKKVAEEATGRVKTLAAKLRQSTLEAAIIDAARAQKFRDPDDVITQLQRSNFDGIEIDQDDDDPSDIEIDKKSVEKAVKKVAVAKPHWLVAAGETGPSGSSFNGGKPGGGKTNTNEAYATRFPALRNRVPRSPQS